MGDRRAAFVLFRGIGDCHIFFHYGDVFLGEFSLVGMRNNRWGFGAHLFFFILRR